MAKGKKKKAAKKRAKKKGARKAKRKVTTIRETIKQGGATVTDVTTVSTPGRKKAKKKKAKKRAKKKGGKKKRSGKKKKGGKRKSKKRGKKKGGRRGGGSTVLAPSGPVMKTVTVGRHTVRYKTRSIGAKKGARKPIVAVEPTGFRIRQLGAGTRQHALPPAR